MAWRITPQTAPSAVTGKTIFWIDSSDGLLRSIDDSSNITIYSRVFIESVAPTVNDDVDLGYRVGDWWINDGDETLFLCLNAGDGVANWLNITSLGGGGVADGDKGDITVSSSGTVWTIDNGVVTLAKLVSATAQYKLLGRASSGSGSFEELSSSADVFSILQAVDYAAIKALLDLEIGTDVQAYNSVLTTLAGASANGQSLITAADYSAMRSLLGLVIGTNVQAYDADLTTWAGKTAPSGDVIGNSDTQTLTNKDLKSVTNTHEELTTVASSSSITPTGGSYRNRITITALAEGTTINAPSGTPVDGNVLLIRIKDDGTSRSVAFDSTFRAVGATLLSATTISKTSYIMATYNSAESKWDVTVCITEA